MPTPVFLVTEYKNVLRKSPANAYTDSDEKIDLWKVGLIHGYYAGMGMNFYFPTEPEAARFTLYTIYRPDEIIELMGGEKFETTAIRQWKYMSAPNRYTDQRTLKDSWNVAFEGERSDFLELLHPWESTARRYKIGRPYTMPDILGILPATPRDTVAILEAYAEQLRRLNEEQELERIRRENAADIPGPNLFPELQPPVSPFPGLPPLTLEEINRRNQQAAEQQEWLGMDPAVKNALLLERYVAEREAYLAQFQSPRDRYLADTYQIHQGNPDLMLQLWSAYQQTHVPEAQFDADVRAYLISRGYVFEEPPDDGGGGGGTIEQRKRTAIAHWHSFTPTTQEVHNTWFAAAQLSAEGRTWETQRPVGAASDYEHWNGIRITGISYFQARYLPAYVNTRNVVSANEFELLCYIVFE